MTLFDRYVLKSFIKVFAVCFLAIQGLLIVGHVFTNLDEMVGIAEARGARHVLLDFYLPRVCYFFDQVFGLLTLVSAIFAYVFLQRTNQTVAVEAGGISKSRIVRPLVFAALLLLGLSIANREFVLPKYRSSLARTAQNWLGDQEVPFGFYLDPASDMVISGSRVKPGTREVMQPEFQLDANGQRKKISARLAEYREATTSTPAGYLLTDVDVAGSGAQPSDPHPAVFRSTVPDESGNKELSALDFHKTSNASTQIEAGKPQTAFAALLTSADVSWLGPREAFVITQADPDHLAYGSLMDRYSSLAQLLAASRAPSLTISNRQRVEFHARLLRPLLDLSIVLLGISLVISRRDRNLFLAAGLAAGVVGLVQVCVLTCNTLGAIRMIQMADLAAWVPIMIFFPLSIAAFRQLK